MTSPNFTRQLISACHPARRAPPDDVREIACHALLDWLSVLCGALDQPVVQHVLREALENGSTPLATLPGLQQKLSLRDAARFNGVASHTLDFDDTHLPSRVHPSTPLWPAVLAQAEALDLTGLQASTAFIAGVEFQSRLAAVLGEAHYAAGWHNTATLGTFGAAYATGILLGLDETALNHAVGIAGSFASGSRHQFGSEAKPLQCGNAAANGLYAARLAQRGVTATEGVFDEGVGYAELLSSQVLRTIDNDRWFTRDIVFKYHASCYGTQAPIHAALPFAVKPLPPGRIDVFIEPQYLQVCNIAQPATSGEARFSVRHMVAMALLGRDTVNEPSFASSLADEAVLAVRQRIEVKADSSLHRACARIEWGDGRLTQAEMNKAEVDHHVQLVRLKAKSRLLLSHRFASGKIEAIHQAVMMLNSASPLRDLCGLLAAPDFTPGSALLTTTE